MAVLAEPSANFHSSGMHRIPPESPESGRNLWGTDKTSSRHIILKQKNNDHLEINAPQMESNPLSESAPGYMTMAFPALFPDGVGDFHQARL